MVREFVPGTLANFSGPNSSSCRDFAIGSFEGVADGAHCRVGNRGRAAVHSARRDHSVSGGQVGHRRRGEWTGWGHQQHRLVGGSGQYAAGEGVGEGDTGGDRNLGGVGEERQCHGLRCRVPGRTGQRDSGRAPPLPVVFSSLQQCRHLPQ